MRLVWACPPGIESSRLSIFCTRRHTMPPLLVDTQVAPTVVESPAGPEFNRPRTRSDRAQRVLDLVVGTVAIVLAAPLIGLAVLAVKLTSRGPAIYTQSRLGR